MAVAISLLIAVSTLSYHHPIVPAEDFTYTEIVRQNFYNNKKVESPKRIVDCLTKYGNQYTPTKYITPIKFKKYTARLIKKESRFKRKAFNKGSKARGLGQHIHRYWGHLLFYIDDGKLGKHIRSNNITNVTGYYFRYGYSIEMTCIAFASCIKIKKGNIPAALKFYSGFQKMPKYCTNEAMKKDFIRKGNSYVNFVMDIR